MKRLDQIIDGYKEEMAEELSTLIQFQSVAEKQWGKYPFGKGVFQAYQHMMRLGKEKGFCCRNFDNYAGDLSLGQAPYIGVAVHLDVVPAGEGWTVDPFGGIRIGETIYGRGAIDNKGCAIAAFYACLAIKESGLPMVKGIRQILGTFEEGGEFPCLMHYMEKTELPECGIVPDAWFPAVYAEKAFCTYGFEKNFDQYDVTQEAKGLKLIRLSGGKAVNIVPDRASAIFQYQRREDANLIEEAVSRAECGAEIKMTDHTIELICKGKSAHASKPEEGENAVSRMLTLLANIRFEPLSLWETIKQTAAAVADMNGKGLDLFCRDETGELTNNVGIIVYKENKLELHMNLRCPVTISKETLLHKLEQAAETLKMQFVMGSYNPAFYVDKESELVKKLTSIYRRCTGDHQSQPVAHGGGSYARKMKNFIPFGPLVPGEPMLFHQPDEHISIEKLMQITKLYAQALYELAKE